MREWRAIERVQGHALKAIATQLQGERFTVDRALDFTDVTAASEAVLVHLRRLTSWTVTLGVLESVLFNPSFQGSVFYGSHGVCPVSTDVALGGGGSVMGMLKEQLAQLHEELHL